MVWCVGGRPIIVLPARLLSELDEQQISMVLAHELAHLRRRDHWIRGAEVLISIIYWWNPLLWWVRRQLHQAEELCCDAWVDWVYPDRKQCYAEVLFKAATLVGTSDRHRTATGQFIPGAGSLKERIETILAGPLPRRISRPAGLILTSIAIVLVPSFVRPVQTAGADRPAAPPTENQTTDAKSKATRAARLSARSQSRAPMNR